MSGLQVHSFQLFWSQQSTLEGAKRVSLLDAENATEAILRRGHTVLFEHTSGYIAPVREVEYDLSVEPALALRHHHAHVPVDALSNYFTRHFFVSRVGGTSRTWQHMDEGKTRESNWKTLESITTLTPHQQRLERFRCEHHKEVR